MKKTSIVVGLLVVALGGVPSPAQGQGWYLGSELGAHVVPALGITGLSNDRASVCDEFINPQYATVTQTAGYEAYNCAGPDRRDNWVNQFARATGLQASWVLGYRFGADASGPRWRHVRTEMEYFYRATAYDQTVAVPGLGAAAHHTVSGVRVSWKMVPAVRDTRRRQSVHRRSPRPSSQHVVQPQDGHLKPQASAASPGSPDRQHRRETMHASRRKFPG